MKKTLLVALVFLCLFNTCGCAHNISDKTSFYYCSADYQFGKDASVIQSEVRDISGHEGELSYLISLYLAGPSSKKLESPFPKNIKLISADLENKHLNIELSYWGKQFSEADFVLACACMTLSTMEFADAEQVTIISGEKSITMERADLLLYDTITSAGNTTEDSK